MTSDTSLRAMAERVLVDVGNGCYPKDAGALATALLTSQSSWAKEREAMERKLAEADAVIAHHLGDGPRIDTHPHIFDARERHASRSRPSPRTTDE